MRMKAMRLRFWRKLMNKILIKSALTVVLFSLIATTFGCGKQEEANKKHPQQPALARTSSPAKARQALLLAAKPVRKTIFSSNKRPVI